MFGRHVSSRKICKVSEVGVTCTDFAEYLADTVLFLLNVNNNDDDIDDNDKSATKSHIKL